MDSPGGEGAWPGIRRGGSGCRGERGGREAGRCAVAGLDGFERGDAIEQVAELVADLRRLLLRERGGRFFAEGGELPGGRRLHDDFREAQLHLGDARVDGAAGAEAGEADARLAGLGGGVAAGGVRRRALPHLRRRLLDVERARSRPANRRRRRFGRLRRRWRVHCGVATDSGCQAG